MLILAFIQEQLSYATTGELIALGIMSSVLLLELLGLCLTTTIKD